MFYINLNYNTNKQSIKITYTIRMLYINLNYNTNKQSIVFFLQDKKIRLTTRKAAINSIANND